MALTALTSSVMGSTAYSRPWNAGFEKVSLHVNNSTADVGITRGGIAAWWLVESGVVTRRSYGIEWGRVAYVAGTTIYVMYVDSAGNSGGFASFTFTVDGTWDYEFFADATLGANGNAGTSAGDPFQTLVYALGESVGALGGDPGSSVCLHLRRGETFDATGATTAYLIDLLGLLGHLCVDDYSTGAKPIINFGDGVAHSGNGTEWSTGGLGDCALTARNIIFNCGAPTSDFRFAAHEGALVGSDGFNLTYIGCEINNFNAAIVGTTTTGVALRDGSTDHFTFVDSTITGCAQGSGIGDSTIWGFSYGRYTLVQDSEISDSYDANGFVRIIAQSHMCWDAVVFSREISGFPYNVFRLPGGAGTNADDACHHNTLHDLLFVQTGEGIELDPVDAPQTYFSDIDAINCKYASTLGGALFAVQVVNGFTADLTRLRVFNCEHRSEGVYANSMMVWIESNASGAQRIRSVELSHNSIYMPTEGESFTAQIGLLNQSGTAGIEAGCFVLSSNYLYGANPSGAGGGAHTTLFKLDAADSVIASSDYNVARKEANVLYWCTGAGGNRDRAAWVLANPTFDTHSVQDVGAAHDFTDVTATDTFNLAPLAGTGPNAGAGEPGLGWLDRNGNLWAATPFAGSRQFGGVAPDGPELGGGGSAPAAPSGLVLTPGTTGISVAYSDNSSDEDNFEVDFKLTSEPSIWTTHDHAIAPNVTTTTITGLTPATAYDVRARAVNASGASAYVTGSTTTLTLPPSPGNRPGRALRLRLGL